jgi:hypothetical protein
LKHTPLPHIYSLIWIFQLALKDALQLLSDLQIGSRAIMRNPRVLEDLAALNLNVSHKTILLDLKPPRLKRKKLMHQRLLATVQQETGQELERPANSL